jgi:DNA-directed RNA polymerase subunit RPC12/RpoP
MVYEIVCPFCGAKIAELLKEKGLTDEDVE